ncbi:MAG: glutamine--fructose-6-phosphate transaminase (isomerizing) [Candidatus Colwellbacteria bacterium]|nr:glutamine--fructose-6-phosphate transaminase (isomerizing) [Candidatus Colwellbacteria bacterium]
MCGIVGYTGKKKPINILVDGLRALEYRGYDSAGVAFWSNPSIKTVKRAGRLNNLVSALQGIEDKPGYAAIGHTRWATHGAPNDLNAHPHSDCTGNIFLVHNGIVENYKTLKEELQKAGHKFYSETDTEVISHLIEEEIKNNPLYSAKRSILNSINKLQGAFALLIMVKSEPEKLFAVRNFSPLVLGINGNDDEYIVASDPTPIARHTRQIIYMNDGDMAIISPKGYEFVDFKHNSLKKDIAQIDWDIEEAQRGGHAHFSAKEIFEQPDVIENVLRGRLIPEEGMAKLGGLETVREKLRGIKRFVITACGTAGFAAEVGEYMFEEYGGVPVEVELASEFRYRKPILDPETAVIFISQSGETADTIAALRESKEKGALTLGIVNVVGSSIARETHAGVYTHAGPEISVASYKAFTAQLTALVLYAMLLGRQRQMSMTMGKRIAEELKNIPQLMRQVLKQSDKVKEIAQKYKDFNNFLYIGRKYNYPIAYEGALKMKEVSYAHAEGYSSAEMKHGPIAMIDENFPTVAIIPKDSVYEKNFSNLQEIKARSGPIIAIATEGDEDIKYITEDVIYIPKTLEMLTPLLTIVPLQLFAYHSGVLRGRDVDRPRNLAKSVTVE